MAESNTKRKLAAILCADVQGYSRLMGANEPLTVQTITAYRELFSQITQQFGGRVVNAPGDAILSEFPSVVDAVNGAVEIQDRLTAENAQLPENQRMIFRIGVNLGDVIEKGPEIYGDGVNIAARVEALAKGGGICITGQVFDQVKKKLNFGYAYLGEHSVKNITEPIRVYQLLTDREDAGKVIDDTGRSGEKAAVQQAVCIAVLPFENMSGNRDHDYFSLGFVEDLIADLSHFPSLLVISSYTSRKMGAEARDAFEIARELNINYLLKGNLRRKDEQNRINTQLLETTMLSKEPYCLIEKRLCRG